MTADEARALTKDESYCDGLVTSIENQIKLLCRKGFSPYTLSYDLLGQNAVSDAMKTEVVNRFIKNGFKASVGVNILYISW